MTSRTKTVIGTSIVLAGLGAAAVLGTGLAGATPDPPRSTDTRTEHGTDAGQVTTSGTARDDGPSDRGTGEAGDRDSATGGPAGDPGLAAQQALTALREIEASVAEAISEAEAALVGAGGAGPGAEGPTGAEVGPTDIQRTTESGGGREGMIDGADPDSDDESNEGDDDSGSDEND